MQTQQYQLTLYLPDDQAQPAVALPKPDRPRVKDLSIRWRSGCQSGSVSNSLSQPDLQPHRRFHMQQSFRFADSIVHRIVGVLGLAQMLEARRCVFDQPLVQGSQVRGSGKCYWKRLRGFSGTLDDIIANDIATGSTVVTISPGDAGKFTNWPAFVSCSAPPPLTC